MYTYIYIYARKGFLSLKNLYGINIRNKDDLRSIGAVCPFLEEIGFDNTWLRHEHCPKLIESIMSRWSNKVKSFLFLS